MLSPPFPEEFFDLGNVGTTRDVFHTLVVNREDCRTDKRLACGIGQLDLDFGICPRFVFFLRWQNFDVDHPLFWRDDHFSHFLMIPAVGNGEGFDEEVRHVLLDNSDFFDGILPLQADNFRRQVDTV